MDRNHGGGQDEQSSQFLGGDLLIGQDEQSAQFLGGDLLLGQDGEISVEELQSLLKELDIPDSFWMGQDNQGVAGTVQHGAPQGVSGELNSLKGSHLQSGDFGNQPLPGTEQQAPGALDADNAIQTLSSYDEESNQQQFVQLPADTPGIQQPSMRQLGQPGAFNSIDQVSPLPVSGTQLEENQMPAAIQSLTQQQFDQAAATAGSCSTRTIGESAISEAKENRLVRKRGYDKAYREREKAKKQKLEDENKEFVTQIQQLKNALWEQDQKMKSKQLKLTELEAKIEDLKEKNLLLNERLEISSREKMRLCKKMKAMKKQIKNLGKQGEETEEADD